MSLNQLGDLAIAEIVFWVPAFVLSIFICARQGFGRRSGWIFISVLGVCRLINASCVLVLELESNPSNDIATAASITGSLGISFLLSTLAGLQIRVFDNMVKTPFIKGSYLQILYVIITVGIVLGIVGATKVTGSNPTPHEISQGYSLLKAATIIYLVAFVLLCGLIVFTMVNMRQVFESQRRLVLAMLLSMPFVFVRLLYSLIAVFNPSQDFDIFDPYIWTEAFMQVFEEFVVTIIILTTGFFVERPQKKFSG